jgi:GT2 family glycosyltransferase
MIPRHADRPVGATSLEPAATDSLVTACFLIDRRRWSGGPLFDETFGFNLEDHDFGVRARLRGHELRVEPRALVRHGDGTAGLSHRPGGSPSADRIFYLVRNRWLVIGKSFSGRTLLLLAPAFVLFELAQLAMLTLGGMGRPWWRALVSLAGRWPSLRDDRREVQRTRRLADGALIRGGPLPFTGWVRAGSFRRLAVGILTSGTDANWRLVRRFL